MKDLDQVRHVTGAGNVKVMAGRNVVLLAAGRGSRLSMLTGETPKPLLPLAGVPAIKWIIDAVLNASPREVTLVVGYKAKEMESYLAAQFGGKIKIVLNERYADDVNILSADMGVDALASPDAGYMIVETDIVMLPSAWRTVLAAGASSHSFWVTRGRYSRHLTGGALRAAQDLTVQEIIYTRDYEEKFEGWHKLLGILCVAPGQVASDRAIRKAYIARSIAQYYMLPWVDRLGDLPCRMLDLGDAFAASFNDMVAYQETNRRYCELLAGVPAGEGARNAGY